MKIGRIERWSNSKKGVWITPDGGRDPVYLHSKDFPDNENSLEVGKRVQFEICHSTGQPDKLAKNCRLLETMPASSTTNPVSTPADEGLSSADTTSAAPEPDPEESQTHLILTVGTNALPVWVAWYHLKNKLNNPKVGFVYTDETKKRKECLEEDCKDKFSISTSPGEPNVVQNTIKNNIPKHLPNGSKIHVHYTGGTQVMGVETVATIATQRQAVERSYLDARSGSSPIIRDRDGNWIGPMDARHGICPDIEKIAKLNGFGFESGASDSPEELDMKDAGKIITFAGTSNAWLKCAVWAALKSSLKRIACADEKRGNYKVLRDVTISPEEPDSNDIKLDVVAVLGYQVIVISCSTLLHEEKKGQNEKGTLKGKGPVKMEAMRAYYQAKQLGGDEARTIILCGLDKNMAKKLQNELHHDIGSEDVPLQVWGNDTWDNLEQEFNAYLKNDLIWTSVSETTPIQATDAEPTSATSQDAASLCQIQNLLLLTVGTNALPIWVAWCHLKEKLENPTIGFVYTEKTRKTMVRLKKHFKCNGTTNFLGVPLSAPGNPKVIGDAIKGMLDGLPNGSKIHVHYTGGTQVMGVETVSTIATEHETHQRSYLDTRSKTIPKIVDKNGTQIGPADAREGICPDIKNIAKLNGFEVSNEQFKSESAPIAPEDFARDNLECSDENKLQKALKKLQDKRQTVKDTDLEYAALAGLKQALETIKDKYSSRDYKRDNYALFQSVYVRRKKVEESDKKVEESDKPEHFELDVVVVLGYQIVVVSCTTTSDEPLIREKAAEAYLRAQQLGGDEARIIVLCNLEDGQRQQLEKELKNDTGSKDVPLQVWGKNKWKNLSNNFKKYLKKLGWE